MKRTITLLLFIVCFTCFSQERIKLKGVDMVNDYHNKISWVKSEEVRLNKDDVIWFGSSYDCKMQLYFGIKVVDKEMRLTSLKLNALFLGDDWIFFDEISFLFGTRKEIRNWKGKRFSISTSGKRTVNRGITEDATVKVEGEAKELIQYILENEPTRLNIRFTNNDRNEYVAFDVEKNTVEKLQKHFQALIDSYNLLNKEYELNQAF